MMLENKIALVTGGSRGIGRAVCVRLASMGATVGVNYVANPAAAETTLEQVREVATATHEQSTASTSIAQQLAKITEVVDSTAHSVAMTASSVEELETLSEELKRLISRFRY